MFFRTAPKPRRPRPVTLGIESLEPRLPLVGDVTVAFNNGTLTITGDAQGNQIWVAQRGDKTVVSPSPWEMNGATRLRFGAAVGMPRVQIGGVHTVVIALQGGNDVLVMGGLPSDPLNFRALTVSLGAGNNSLSVQDMIVEQNLTVRAGGGADSVSVVSSQIDGTLDIATGLGDDRVTLEDIRGMGAFIVNTGDGNDSVFARGWSPGAQSLAVNLGNGQNEARFINFTLGGPMTVTGGAGQDLIETRIVDVQGHLTIDAGDGNNQVRMRATSARSGQITTGQGVDRVSMDASGRYTNELRLRTGGGADSVSILGIEAGAIDVDLGAGDDSVLLAGGLFHRRTWFDGGTGRDTVRFIAGEFGTKFFTGFEEFILIAS